jgi:hypothetical protein
MTVIRDLLVLLIIVIYNHYRHNISPNWVRITLKIYGLYKQYLTKIHNYSAICLEKLPVAQQLKMSAFVATKYPLACSKITHLDINFSQMNPVQFLTFYFKITVNIILPSLTKFPEWLFPSDLPINFMYIYHFSIRATQSSV